MDKFIRILLLAYLIILGGCSPFRPPIYNWQAYNQVMANEVVEPDKFDPMQAIQTLRSALETMPTTSIPPGALTHLAFLMEQNGLSLEAKTLVERESEIFPESSIWKKTLLSKKASGQK